MSFTNDVIRLESIVLDGGSAAVTGYWFGLFLFQFRISFLVVAVLVYWILSVGFVLFLVLFLVPVLDNATFHHSVLVSAILVLHILYFYYCY